MRKRDWYERRRDRGIVAPLLYLLLETVILAQLVYITALVTTVGAVAVGAGSLIFFFRSCLPRFRRALRRQARLEARKAYA